VNYLCIMHIYSHIIQAIIMHVAQWNPSSRSQDHDFIVPRHVILHNGFNRSIRPCKTFYREPHSSMKTTPKRYRATQSRYTACPYSLVYASFLPDSCTESKHEQTGKPLYLLRFQSQNHNTNNGIPEPEQPLTIPCIASIFPYTRYCTASR